MNVALLQPFHERPAAELVARIQRAAQRLSIATRSWSTVSPPRTAVDEVLAVAHGLSRSLASYQTQAKRSP